MPTCPTCKDPRPKTQWGVGDCPKPKCATALKRKRAQNKKRQRKHRARKRRDFLKLIAPKKRILRRAGFYPWQTMYLLTFNYHPSLANPPGPLAMACEIKEMFDCWAGPPLDYEININYGKHGTNEHKSAHVLVRLDTFDPYLSVQDIHPDPVKFCVSWWTSRHPGEDRATGGIRRYGSPYRDRNAGLEYFAANMAQPRSFRRCRDSFGGK